MYKESILKELVGNILTIKTADLVKDEMYVEFKSTLELKFKEFMTSESVKNILYKLAEERMIQIEKENKTLKEVLPPGFENSLKVLVYNKGPEITDVVKGFINNDKFKHTIRVEINKFVSGMGPMVSKFISIENIYNRIMMSILSYIQNPDTMMNIVNGINNKIDESSSNRITDFSNSIPYEGKLSFMRALVDAGIAAINEDSFIKSIGVMFDEELLSYSTLGELLQSIGITEERLVKKGLGESSTTT